MRVGLLCGVMLAVSAVGQSLSLPPGTRLRVTVPVYLGANAEPSLVLHVRELSGGYERRGFFRIGVLPVLVADGVTIEVRNETEAARALRRIPSSLAPHANRGLAELRHVTFQFRRSDRPTIEAGRIRLGSGPRWSLEDVRVHLATGDLELRRAALAVTGAEAGRLTWDSEGRLQSLDLLSRASAATSDAAAVAEPISPSAARVSVPHDP